ncbi:hypothetical protein L6164_013932 [Bauhinia variegata]|uniref:Uncharacterized protein n=1 Tax=Bauhinia variegata TaxID=167791 RepID=A0ACB9NKL3_BAUVA|nr:hypothetical protein L6164_013932 [Bauhinia variegata]
MLSSNLPDDIVKEIILWVPVKSLLRLKCVAKSWYALLTSPDFIARHLDFSNSITQNRSVQFIFRLHNLTLKPFISLLSNQASHVATDIALPFTEEHVQYIFVYGQCNGIFCLYGVYNGESRGYSNGSSIILWNPATREVKVLPPSQRQPRDLVYVIFGFGIDPKTKDYKVVRFGNLAFEGREQPPVEVYNLSTNSWRTIKVTVPAFRLCYPKCRAYLNGVYHWLTDEQNDKAILCFDFAKEVFGKMQLPPIVETTCEVNVDIIDERLAFVATYCSAANFRFDIWVMNEYGVERSWTKRFNVGPRIEFGSFLGFWRDNEILVEDEGRLISYNLDTELIQSFQVHGISRLFRVFGCVESLVPLTHRMQ